MDWRVVVLIFSLGLLASVYGQDIGKPSIKSSSRKVYTALHEIGYLECSVQNLGNGKVNWVFVKHGTQIFDGNSLLVQDTRYHYHHPQDSNKYSLQILDVQVGDQGVYKCEIDGENVADTVELVILGSPVSPDVNVTVTPLNVTDCCLQQNVSASCRPACHPSSSPVDMDYVSACPTDLPKLIYCGSDGRNHENCCARSGVPAGCLLFCSNDRLRVPTISDDELICLNYTDQIISCYEIGGALLPTAPQSLSVLPASSDNAYSLVVSWKAPQFNPSAVSAYKIHYKKSADSKFTVASVNAGTYNYEIRTEVDVLYSIYIVAVGHHGSSQPTDIVNIVSVDTSPPGHATDVRACCLREKVPDKCRPLCHPKTWSTFNTNEMLECYGSLEKIFSCLAGKRDNSGCCRSHSVADLCIGMCSGSPPAFNTSISTCIRQLSIIEACVQNGLSTQPGPPLSLTLAQVDVHTAEITWTAPNVTGSPINTYYVQLQRGTLDRDTDWEVVASVTNTFVTLTNLTETETYHVRVISETDNASSLPSATLSFTTYPEITTEERPTIEYNLTQCCIDQGMPLQCALGCQYMPNMTAYYQPIIGLCMPHIGSVLSCAADGRNHTECCRERGVQEFCYPMCSLNKQGYLDPSFLACMLDTSLIVMCHREGLDDLVRMPDSVNVTSLTRHSMTVAWENPETGPRPDYYIVSYTNLNTSVGAQGNTSDLTYVMQDLTPATGYTITVTSYNNNSFSPPTNNVTYFTPALDSYSPFVPGAPSNTSRVLWNNRTHCCQSSDIREECQPLCLNQPTPEAPDCSTEDPKILTCAADGQDHGVCCEENGLPRECLPLCRSHATGNFSVRMAGCLADASLAIITSCFLEYSGLVPSVVYGFTAQNLYGTHVRLSWGSVMNCDAPESCIFDVHYWKASSTDLSTYTTNYNVKSPHDVEGLEMSTEYTFTITARNSKGSGPPAPWHNVYLGLVPDILIAQDSKQVVFEQGSSVSLSCNVFNFGGKLNYTWHLRNRQLATSGRVLSLENLQKTSEGNYSCYASSDNFTIKAESYVNVRFKPEFNYFRTDTAKPNVGAEAVLACWFRGHPYTDNPRSVWTKDGKPIPESSRTAASAKSRFHTGITPFKIKIANVVQSDYGSYQCNVSNQFGYAVAKTKLIDPDKMPPPIPLTPYQQRNVSECCRVRGIIDTCMPLCTFEVSAAEAWQNPEKYGVCLLYFDELIKCAADGADHTLCCEEEVVAGTCLPFCKGEVPPTNDDDDAPHLLPCIEETPTILNCMAKGYDKIPTAPRNVVAKFVGNNIQITWTIPERNGKDLTSYNVYYNFTGHPHVQTETITSLHRTDYVLTNVDLTQVYQIWLTAERYKFGRSQISNIVTVGKSGTLPMPPPGVASKVDGTSVVISWQQLPPQSPYAESFAVYYKQVNAVKLEKIVTREYSVTVTGLKPNAHYMAYVKSKSRQGEGQSSQTIKFNTGGEKAGTSAGQEGLQGGQIAGIVLAIIVAIVVIGVITFFLMRSRTGRKNLNDTVAFENPGYGNQQVHIGSLPTTNPYDNALESQNQPEKDGDFTYARLSEDQAGAATEAARAANSAPETDNPNTQYAKMADPDSVAVNVDSNGSAKLDEKNESKT